MVPARAAGLETLEGRILALAINAAN